MPSNNLQLVQELMGFVDHLRVMALLSADLHISPVREGDRLLIMEMCLNNEFTEKMTTRLNWVRKYKGIIHLSDVMTSDGKKL